MDFEPMPITSSLKKVLDLGFGSGPRGREREERVKFFLRWDLMSGIAGAALNLFGAPVNRDGWDDRVLIIGAGGIGDVIMATPALRQYRAKFASKKIFLLVTKHGGMTKAMFGDLVDDLVVFDGVRFQSSPGYQVATVNRLRRIGFRTVVNDAAGLKDLTSKLIAVSLKAETVVGYEGPGIELLDLTAAPFVRFSRSRIFGRYTRLVESIDKDFMKQGTHPKTAIQHHLALADALHGHGGPRDPSTAFGIDPAADAAVLEKIGQWGTKPGRYVAFAVACVDPARQWNIGKFAEVAKAVHARGFDVLVIGSPAQQPYSREFGKHLPFPLIDTAGAVTLMESAAVIRHAHMLITNDTGPVHIAVALGVPTICIATAGHIAFNSLYGRKAVNRWIYKDIGCLYDDARCALTVPQGSPAPCLEAVTAAEVVADYHRLDDYLHTHPERTEPFLAAYMDA
ncbi:MAG TPA: glycosyltransferase family 9 protein [Candidatus Paceibacterota bacterium]|nr:glycosyltransferase family 9 protein [Candidatus Paceibacterota bacterium]